jgi:hypothetical protein
MAVGAIPEFAGLISTMALEPGPKKIVEREKPTLIGSSSRAPSGT